MNWKSIATIVLTAITGILCGFNVISTEESTTLATSGAAAITGVAGFVTAILAVIANHKGKGDGGEDKAA